MITNAQRGTAVCAFIAAITMVGFQNCAQIPQPDPISSVTLPSTETPIADLSNLAKISLIAATNFVPEDQDVQVTVQYENVRDVTLSCKDNLTGETLIGQLVDYSGEIVAVKIDRDILCVTRGIAIHGRTPVQAQSLFQVSCGARVKNISTNRCE